MSPEAWFQVANTIALTGWLALALSPLAQRYFSHPACYDGGLLRWHHAYGDICFSSEQVADGVTGDQFYLYFGQR
jgi:hypothetical protein